MQNQDNNNNNNNTTLEENKTKIKEEFDKLHKIFQTMELDILKQLETKQVENDLKHSIIESTIEEENKIINEILEKHKNIETYTIENIFNEETKQHIEIIKDNYEAKKLIDKKLIQTFDEYQEHSVEFDEEQIDRYFDQLKKSFSFKPLDENDSFDKDDEEDIETLTSQDLNVQNQV
ncbi:hypothetical protein DICPUDRAFT_81562 [Dictyostelium purpureum]|uniref:Uncharacterized protein n=1 Tax=Dictyostelium purpureum TaxID=5786 RepID=F0ZTV8_DICPU|nr:uncharacterized protein DICPUDRAFT_81562 [Dictyostelium purpureum]EGC32640.1 hypothetical protein DICPUDRAFT_81562 [Dictyostelium purpureum]|eukprot:XP_003290855.1 hypothetical protein DICPUDRAFT_81562 [Dictyostelium purpureum]